MRLWVAVKMTIVMTLLTGIAYPFAMVGLAHLFFPRQAEGSLIVHDGHVVGSELIGQNFSSSKYFHPRPSAAGDKGYDASNSSGSNLGPTNKTLIETVRSRVSTLREHEPGINHGEIPVDMVTASGSGLDPEISPAAADLQVPQIAEVRGITQETVRSLVSAHTRVRTFGVLGEPGVNVLELNLALDELSNSVHSKDVR
ncbi:MAG TPA: potassium-transporting ATPase subunit KdpC [Candidatus Binataceae bacterium]|nr:potassium-transporting ATPase subunit KdpC [Candidatus Binataceae bacterium]